MALTKADQMKQKMDTANQLAQQQEQSQTAQNMQQLPSQSAQAMNAATAQGLGQIGGQGQVSGGTPMGVQPDPTQGGQPQNGGSAGGQPSDGGLGQPPAPAFDYTENPSTILMNTHTLQMLSQDAQAKQQSALAAQMAVQKAAGATGYAGYQGGSTPEAVNQHGVPLSQVHPDDPNQGWRPKSEQAHNMNMAVADKIKSGQMDPQTAAMVIQNPNIAPEIKQALQGMMQGQGGGQPTQAPQGTTDGGQQPSGSAPQGLGQMPQQG